MEPTEEVQLARELARELMGLAAKFCLERIPAAAGSETVKHILVLGTVQTTAAIMVTLDSIETETQEGMAQIMANRIRLEGQTEEESERFNTKVTNAAEAILKTIYEQ